jgi:hypothetical protein
LNVWSVGTVSMAASIINLKAGARFGPQCREALVRHFEPDRECAQVLAGLLARSIYQ